MSILVLWLLLGTIASGYQLNKTIPNNTPKAVIQFFPNILGGGVTFGMMLSDIYQTNSSKTENDTESNTNQAPSMAE